MFVGQGFMEGIAQIGEKVYCLCSKHACYRGCCLGQQQNGRGWYIKGMYIYYGKSATLPYPNESFQ